MELEMAAVTLETAVGPHCSHWGSGRGGPPCLTDWGLLVAAPYL